MTSEDKPKSGFSVREWLLASFAGIGLIISLATTWLATFRTVDEVRIVFNTLPSVTHIPGAVSISPNMKMTFINSGNRNVVLLGAVLRIIEDEATCEKVHWDQASVTLDMEPFILKASEIVIKEGKFKVHTDPSALISIDANGNSIYDWKFGSQANAATKEKDHHASVCIYVEFATPSMHKTSFLRLRYLDIKPSFIETFIGPRVGYDTSAPWIVVHVSGNIFSSDRTYTSRSYIDDD